jgi:hypothetical protein
MTTKSGRSIVLGYIVLGDNEPALLIAFESASLRALVLEDIVPQANCVVERMRHNVFVRYDGVPSNLGERHEQANHCLLYHPFRVVGPGHVNTCVAFE